MTAPRDPGMQASAPRFHVAAIELRAGSDIALPDAVAHHATRVLRLGAGDALTLFDGHGGEYAARLSQVDRRGARAAIERFVAIEREAPVVVTLAPSVLAADAMDVALRKAVELGVARIEPVVATRSQGGAHGAQAQRRIAHWRQVVTGACEQCGRNRVPPLADAVPLDIWLAGAGAADIVLVPGAPHTLLQRVADTPARAIVVGPEGGFTEDELAIARHHGLRAAALGAAVLRADTAAIAALAVVQALAGAATRKA
ncbi:MAG TPA: 16S rRNA (uracil(1498)-N(3))-methyltransferase [Casimicrobiaceae bacterium]